MEEKKPTEIEQLPPEGKVSKVAKTVGVVVLMLKGIAALAKELLELFKSWKGML